MLTAYLEKLIHEGKATFKTFTAGGAQKSVINVPDDRYIIILGYTWFPFVANENKDVPIFIENRVVQMSILSDKSYNTFIHRNNTGVDTYRGETGGLQNAPRLGEPVIQNNLYLIHDKSVSFIFSRGDNLNFTAVGATPSKAPAKPAPLGYGRTGYQPALIKPVALEVVPVSVPLNTAGFRPMGDFTAPTGTTQDYKELKFPIDDALLFAQSDLQNSNDYPIVNVRYIEIKGNPTNIQGTN